MAGAIHYRDTDHINNIPVDVQHPLPVQILEPTTSTDDAGPAPDIITPPSAEVVAARLTNELLLLLLTESRRQTTLLMEAFSIRGRPEELDEVRQLPS